MPLLVVEANGRHEDKHPKRAGAARFHFAELGIIAPITELTGVEVLSARDFNQLPGTRRSDSPNAVGTQEEQKGKGYEDIRHAAKKTHSGN
mmetsp:Transcript_142977/g.372427  ORF Transcript_142977/g.372427 Transcript_142977/m.372427 type:complete len:91 (-) Transcript_142977:37-309(-)